jgi:hypothetical protein
MDMAIEQKPVTVLIPAHVEKEILDRMNAHGRVEVRLLDESVPDGTAWCAVVEGWENEPPNEEE